MKKLTIIFCIVLLFSGCKKQVKIDDTVISLKEFRSIGELITAEYYGEVVSGLSLFYSDSISANMDEMFNLIKKDIISATKAVNSQYTKKDSSSSNDIKTSLEKNKKSKSLSATDSIRKNRRLERKNQRVFLKNLRNNGLVDHKEIFKELKKATGLNKRNLIATIKVSEFNEIESLADFKKYKNKMVNKRKGKKELVYMGRGSVKAGYDLTKIKNENIFFSTDKDTIYIVDIDPELLNVDINPWFYFPNDMPDTLSFENSKELRDDLSLFGFQVLMGNKLKNIKLSEINRIKTECKNLLRQEALDRDIYEKARVNAEEALEGFFGLMSLSASQEVKKVIISHSKYFYDKTDFLYDQKIDDFEFKIISEVVQDDTTDVDTLFYGFQTLSYQVRLLDLYVIDLYKWSLGKNNSPEWYGWANKYFYARDINIKEHLAL